MIYIQLWSGRSGNNVLQIIRAIHYAIINNHNLISFKPHELFNKTQLYLNSSKEDSQNEVKDIFFSLKKFNIVDPEPYVMKEYFQQYIAPIFNIKIKNIIENSEILHVHFRGGDIFSKNPHKAYVQPPLLYYENIIKCYDNVKLVCEDNKNPCINELLKQSKVSYVSNSLKEDLKILLNAQHLVISFGTFGFLLYLANPNIKNLYIPQYVLDELPKGNWGNNIKLHVIDLPNYIKVGEWKFSDAQRKLMLEYTPLKFNSQKD